MNRDLINESVEDGIISDRALKLLGTNIAARSLVQSKEAQNIPKKVDTIQHLTNTKFGNINEKIENVKNTFNLNPYHLTELNCDGGIDKFKKICSDFISNNFECELKWTNLIIAPGKIASIDILAFSLLDIGDAVLCLSPDFDKLVEIFEGRNGVNLIPVQFNDIFTPCLSRNLFEAALNEHSNIKAIILTNPQTPTGGIFSIEELNLVLDFAEHHNLAIIIDESDAMSVYDENVRFQSILTLKNRIEKFKNIYWTWSFNTDIGLPGLQFSLIYAEDNRTYQALHKLSAYQPCNALTQSFAVEFLEDKEWFRGYKKTKNDELRSNRDMVMNMFRKLQIPFVKPFGGHFIYFNITHNAETIFIKLMHNDIFLQPFNFGRYKNEGWFVLNLSQRREDLWNLLDKIDKVVITSHETKDIKSKRSIQETVADDIISSVLTNKTLLNLEDIFKKDVCHESPSKCYQTIKEYVSNDDVVNLDKASGKKDESINKIILHHSPDNKHDEEELPPPSPEKLGDESLCKDNFYSDQKCNRDNCPICLAKQKRSGNGEKKRKITSINLDEVFSENKVADCCESDWIGSLIKAKKNHENDDNINSVNSKDEVEINNSDISFDNRIISAGEDFAGKDCLEIDQTEQEGIITHQNNVDNSKTNNKQQSHNETSFEHYNSHPINKASNPKITKIDLSQIFDASEKKSDVVDEVNKSPINNLIFFRDQRKTDEPRSCNNEVKQQSVIHNFVDDFLQNITQTDSDFNALNPEQKTSKDIMVKKNNSIEGKLYDITTEEKTFSNNITSEDNSFSNSISTKENLFSNSSKSKKNSIQTNIQNETDLPQITTMEGNLFKNTSMNDEAPLNNEPVRKESTDQEIDFSWIVDIVEHNEFIAKSVNPTTFLETSISKEKEMDRAIEGYQCEPYTVMENVIEEVSHETIKKSNQTQHLLEEKNKSVCESYDLSETEAESTPQLSDRNPIKKESIDFPSLNYGSTPEYWNNESQSNGSVGKCQSVTHPLLYTPSLQEKSPSYKSDQSELSFKSKNSFVEETFDVQLHTIILGETTNDNKNESGSLSETEIPFEVSNDSYGRRFKIHDSKNGTILKSPQSVVEKKIKRKNQDYPVDDSKSCDSGFTSDKDKNEWTLERRRNEMVRSLSLNQEHHHADSDEEMSKDDNEKNDWTNDWERTSSFRSVKKTKRDRGPSISEVKNDISSIVKSSNPEDSTNLPVICTDTVTIIKNNPKINSRTYILKDVQPSMSAENVSFTTGCILTEDGIYDDTECSDLLKESSQDGENYNVVWDKKVESFYTTNDTTVTDVKYRKEFRKDLLVKDTEEIVTNDIMLDVKMVQKHSGEVTGHYVVEEDNDNSFITESDRSNKNPLKVTLTCQSLKHTELFTSELYIPPNQSSPTKNTDDESKKFVVTRFLSAPGYERAVVLKPDENDLLLSKNNGMRAKNVYIKYSYVYGPDWKFISGLEEGISCSGHCSSKNNEIVINTLLQATFSSTNPFKWPQIVISCYGSDLFGHDIIYGYGCVHLPTVSGTSKLTIPLFVPQSSSGINRIMGVLTGRRAEFIDPRVITSFEGREITRVTTQGICKLSFNVILNNTKKFGYDMIPATMSKISEFVLPDLSANFEKAAKVEEPTRPQLKAINEDEDSEDGIGGDESSVNELATLKSITDYNEGDSVAVSNESITSQDQASTSKRTNFKELFKKDVKKKEAS
uniref:Aminotran_1_2 domain-containing protein n=1 Tax=Rhabditophanes sp. KR3021 TaxID=114890 RepID=A0AC35UI04_9BILA